MTGHVIPILFIRNRFDVVLVKRQQEMETTVNAYKTYLKYLTTLKTRKQILTVVGASSDIEIRALLELIGNLNHGGIFCKYSDIKKLKKYKSTLDTLYYEKKSIKTKRKELVRNSNLLLTVIITATAFISQL